MVARTIAAFSFAGALLVSACSQQHSVPGQIVVALDTDMALPDQIDTIELIVSVEGSPLLDIPLTVGTGPDSQAIPATLTLVAGSDPSLPATVQVIGKKDGVARTVRQVTTTVPTGRVAMLRMPIQWLCDGTAQTTSDSDAGTQSTCGPDATCKEGQCVPSQTDSSSLGSYQPQLVFGGGTAPSGTKQTTGTCFDTIACMASGAVEKPDDQCTVDLPAGGAGINVGLSVAGTGICDPTGTTCYVPLDQDPDEGWSVQDGRLALPPAVCTKLRTGLVTGVVVSTACAVKTAAVPPCGPWSSVTPAADASEGLVDASVPPEPTILATLGPDSGASTVCCPLMADSTRLYTCTCAGSTAGSPVDIVSIDPSTGATSPVGSFTPVSTRTQYSAVLADGQVWWVDRTTSPDTGSVCSVFGTSAADGGTGGPLAVVDGDIYDGADILADAANLYLLADNVMNLAGLSVTASPVQLLRVSRASGAVTPFDTGGGGAILQFTQDADALYVAADIDSPLDAGVERISRVTRFPKAGGPPTQVVQTAPLVTSDARHGGFIGLQDDGTTLFALFESPPAADGTVATQVLELDPSDAGSTIVYQEVVDPNVVALRMLGAVNGAVLLARKVTSSADAGSAMSESAVLAIPASGGRSRILASFVQDAPIYELQTPTFSPDAFWVNQSGRLFRLPAGALR